MLYHLSYAAVVLLCRPNIATALRCVNPELAARKLDPAPDAEVECGAMTAVDGSHRWRKESTK